MEDHEKTREQVLQELAGLRQILAATATSQAEQEQREKRLRASEERFQTLAAAGFEGIAITEAGRIVDGNEQLARLLGYAMDELLGMEVRQLVVPEDQDRVLRNILGGIEATTEHGMVRKDGQVIAVEAGGKMLSYQGTPTLMTAIRDVTDRKRAEDALRQSRDQFVRLADNLPRSFVYQITHDASDNRRFLYVSAAVERIMNITPDEVKADASLLYRQILEPFKPIMEQAEVTSARNQSLFDVEVPVRVTDGTVKWLHICSMPHRTEDGQLVWHGITTDVTDRKRAEEALAAAAREWMATFDAMVDGVSVHDSDYTIRNVNQSLCQLLGRTKEELIGEKCHQVFHGSNAPIAGCPIEESRRTFRKESAEVFESTLNKWLTASASPIFDDAGHLVRFVHTVRDISERKRAEETLRQSEQQLRNVLNTPVVAVGIGDATGRITYVNDYFLRLLGYSREELLEGGVTWHDLTPPEYADVDRRCLEELEHNGAFGPYEKENIRKDGTRVPILVGVSRLPGEPVNHAAFLLDISDRKAVELALRDSEERYRLLVESIPQLAWRMSADGLEVAFNRRWYEYTGQTPRQVRGHGWLAAVHPDDLLRVFEQATHAANSGGPYDIEYRLRRASDASYRWHLARAIPMRDKDGQVICWFGSATDIEDLKRAQELLKRAHEEQLQRHQTELAHMARLSMMGEMAVSLAHEINQPLHAVRNYARGGVRRVLKSAEKDGELIAALERISDEANRAAEIVRRVRRFVQKREPHFSEVSVNDLIEEVVLFSKAELEQSHARIVLEISDDLPTVVGDPIQIEQVIMNLLRNGLEAMDETPEGERLLVIKAMPQGDAGIQVDVRDCGEGISVEDQERVFEPFFTTKPEGMGMGLAIARSIIRASGGRLWVSANQDQGCTFHFTLPVGKRS